MKKLILIFMIFFAAGVSAFADDFDKNAYTEKTISEEKKMIETDYKDNIQGIDGMRIKSKKAGALRGTSPTARNTEQSRKQARQNRAFLRKGYAGREAATGLSGAKEAAGAIAEPGAACFLPRAPSGGWGKNAPELRKKKF